MTFFLKQTFDSWAEFDQQIEKLARVQGIAIVCSSIGKFPKDSEEVLKYGYKYKVMECPRSGQSTAAHARTSRSIRENCPFKIYANFHLQKKKIEIRQLHLTHLHRPENVQLQPNHFLELDIQE